MCGCGIDEPCNGCSCGCHHTKEDFILNSPVMTTPEPSVEEMIQELYGDLCETGMCDANSIAQKALGAVEAVLELCKLQSIYVSTSYVREAIGKALE